MKFFQSVKRRMSSRNSGRAGISRPRVAASHSRSRSREFLEDTVPNSDFLDDNCSYSSSEIPSEHLREGHSYSRQHSVSQSDGSDGGLFSAGEENSSSFPVEPLSNNIVSVEEDTVDYFSHLPQIRDVPLADRFPLFLSKLKLCCIIFDFNNPSSDIKAKEIKRLTLIELVDFVNNTRSGFTSSHIQAIVRMVVVNIFRPLPPPSVRPVLRSELDLEDPVMEVSWPHMQIVYEFFVRFLVTSDVDPRILEQHIESKFIIKLLELFNSEDPRERDYLKTILHRIYGKMMSYRGFIRRSIQNVFYEFIYEDEAHNGISELLEILGSIINGFALPLKEEHEIFLNRSIIPLHKARSLNTFHQRLTYCMTQYVEKDSRLSECIILGMLKCWPVTNSPKEVLFLNELEEVLQITSFPEFEKVMVRLLTRLAESIQSSHFQVAERVLFLWNNERIVKMINKYRKELFSIVVPALYKNSRIHWNPTVHALTYNVAKLLEEADPVLFHSCITDFTGSSSWPRHKERHQKWESLEEKASCVLSSKLSSESRASL